MQLILVEKEAGKPINERVLPLTDSFTIGREGDIVPSVGLSWLLSRIHATVMRQKDGSWLVIDGYGMSPSKNGLWASPTERVMECVIKEPGQFVDLVSLEPTVLMVRVLGSAVKYDRATTGIQEYSLESVHEELEEIRSWQRLHSDRSERIEAKVTELGNIKPSIDQNIDRMTKIEEALFPALDEIVSIAIDNKRQDAQIQRSGLLMKAIGVVVVVLLAGASIDKDRRSQYVDIALTLMVSGGVGAAAINEAGKRGH